MCFHSLSFYTVSTTGRYPSPLKVDIINCSPIQERLKCFRFSLRRVGARCPHHILDFDDEPNLQDFLAEEHHFLEYSHPCRT